MGEAWPVGRPWLVMVTGEPGSGKTTLARHLAQLLRLPYLSRDDVRGGLLATAGLWTAEPGSSDRRPMAVEAFTQLAEAAARLGVSAVVELVVSGPERADAFRRLSAAAHTLVVHTVCHDAAARAVARDLADPLLNRPRVLQALGYDTVADYVAAASDRVTEVRDGMRVDLDRPSLRVSTDDGYDPPLTEIVDWIVSCTQRPR